MKLESAPRDAPSQTCPVHRGISNLPQYGKSPMQMLKLVSASKNDDRDSFAVFDDENCVGHVMRTQKSPAGKPWFWTIFVSGTHDGAADRGYAATQQRAMMALEAAWAEFRNLLTMRAQPRIGG